MHKNIHGIRDGWQKPPVAAHHPQHQSHIGRTVSRLIGASKDGLRFPEGWLGLEGSFILSTYPVTVVRHTSARR